jgi:protein phosphatase
VKLRVGQRSDVGRTRNENQDSLLVDLPLLLVADGMGGNRGGGTASSLAVEVFQNYVPRLKDGEDPAEVLDEAAVAAHQRILSEGDARPELSGMGTTLTAASARPGGKLMLVHVGDSRCYRMRDGILEQITEDDSYVGELERAGQITKEDARVHPHRSLITKALGAGEADELEPAVFEIEVRNGDRVLLCSDGLYSMLDDEEIKSILVDNDDPSAAAHELVEAANERMSTDNVTVVVADVIDGGGEGIEFDMPARIEPLAAPAEPEEPADTVTSPVAAPAPIPAVEPAEERGVVSDVESDGAVGAGAAADAGDDAIPLVERRRARRPLVKALVAAGAVVLLVLVLIFGGRWFVLRNWFVGCDSGGQVAVYRGVPHDVIGFSFQRLAFVSTPPVPCDKLLQPPRAGVTVANEGAARSLVENYRCQADKRPSCPTTTG